MISYFPHHGNLMSVLYICVLKYRADIKAGYNMLTSLKLLFYLVSLLRLWYNLTQSSIISAGVFFIETFLFFLYDNRKHEAPVVRLNKEITHKSLFHINFCAIATQLSVQCTYKKVLLKYCY